MKKVKMLLVMSVVFAFALMAFVGCGAVATTSHSGRTLDGSFTVVDATLTMINPTEHRTLLTTWEGLETNAETAATPFRPRNMASFNNNRLPTEGRLTLPINRFGETLWGYDTGGDGPRALASRTVGQGYFQSQTRNVNLEERNLGTITEVATALGLATAAAIAAPTAEAPHGRGPVAEWDAWDLNAMIGARWSLTGAFRPATWTDATTEADMNAARNVEQDLMRIALTNLFLPQNYRDLGYFVNDTTWLEVRDIRADGAADAVLRVFLSSGSYQLIRHIRANITRIETYFGYATYHNGHSFEIERNVMWDAYQDDIIEIIGVPVVIYQGLGGQLRPIFTNREVTSLYDRGNLSDHWATSTYFGDQVESITVAGNDIIFIVNR